MFAFLNFSVGQSTLPNAHSKPPPVPTTPWGTLNQLPNNLAKPVGTRTACADPSSAHDTVCDFVTNSRPHGVEPLSRNSVLVVESESLELRDS